MTSCNNRKHHNHYSYHHRSTSSSYSSSSIYHGSSSYPSEQPSQPSQPSLQPNNTSTVSSSLNVNHSPQKTLFETPTKPIQIPVFAPTYEETWTHCKVEGQRLREAEVKLTESVRKSQIDLDKASWELKKVIHQTALATRQIEILFSNNEKEVEALNKLAEKEIAVNKETGNIQDGNQQGQQDGNQQGQQDENVNSGKIDDIFAQLENTKISIKENLEREEPPSCWSSVLMYFVLKKWLKVV
ncbi:22030_t:CDS:2 [Entrophospora sp. SA101]|nr:22030_t:CDS:2 [Entrophospora sp. SA101]